MTKRIILGGLLAGLVMFIWGALSHTFLDLYASSVKSMPPDTEESVMARANPGLKSPGFYLFPGMEDHKSATPEQVKAWEDKYRKGPRGILVYQPEGTSPMGPPQLLRQLACDLVVGLLAALLLATASPLLSRFSARILFVMLLGALPWLTLSFPYWNWYGFPTDFTLVTLFDILLKFLFGGLVLAGIVKRPAA